MAADSDDMKKLLQGMQTTMTGMMQGMQQMGTVMTQLAERVSNPQTPTPKEEEFTTEGVDLERLSRKDLVNFVMKGVNASITGALKPIKDHLGQVETTSTKQSVQQQVEKLQSDPKNKDFNDWIPEIKSILKENQNLSIKAALTLARDGNPDKYKELTDKYKLNEEPVKPDADKTKEKAKPPVNDKSKTKVDDKPKDKDKKPSFGGLPPGGGAEEEHNDSMDINDAGAKALDDVLSRNPEALEYFK